MRKFTFILGILLCGISTAAWPQAAADKPAQTETTPASQYTGMYSFLREGEFVQITIDASNHVTGFISRYGQLESDKDAFLDHFFKNGTFDGNKIGFTTATVHGVWYQFQGSFGRGEGKTPGDEGYHLLQGTLVENTSDAGGKEQARSREVALKSFPKELK